MGRLESHGFGIRSRAAQALFAPTATEISLLEAMVTHNRLVPYDARSLALIPGGIVLDISSAVARVLELESIGAIAVVRIDWYTEFDKLDGKYWAIVRPAISLVFSLGELLSHESLDGTVRLVWPVTRLVSVGVSRPDEWTVGPEPLPLAGR
jgi:hypothetical protein